MAIITMPTSMTFQEVQWGLETNSQITLESPLNRSVQRIVLPGARWLATFTLPPMKESEDTFDDWKAFLMQLKGSVNTFQAYPPHRSTPKGVATGTPLVNGASQTGTSLATDGWTAGVTGILKTGDYFSVNNELKQLVASANSTGGGGATLVFEPALRNSPADNATITTVKPYCLMRLVDDGQTIFSIDTSKIYQISFQAVETFF